MNTKQAINIVRDTVTQCDPAKLVDLATILELGAGNRFLEDKTVEAKRNSIIMELVDAVVYSTCNHDDEYQPQAEFVPVYNGSWELVLASLVIDQDWTRIGETAQELRKEENK
jgi:hypothetical protein